MNHVKVTVDDLRRVMDVEVGRRWSGRQWVEWLDGAATLHGLSFRNVVLVRMQLPGATWVDGPEGWQRRGRRVMRGESGIRIIAPAVGRGNRSGVVQGHGVAEVWDVSQTSGGTIEMPSVEAVADVTAETVYAALTDVVATAGYVVVRGRPQAATALAETQFSRRRIVVRDDLSAAFAVMGLAHELAHLRMHKLSRDALCHGLSRLEADGVAYLVLARFGCLPDVSALDLVGDAARTVGRKPSTRLVETLGGRVVTTARRLIQVTENRLPLSPSGRLGLRPRIVGPADSEPEPPGPAIGMG
ncbi:hypothetical protein ACI2LF_32040 [Kribbella sp. NPDC020789]